MKTTIHMSFSKATKRTTVFTATDEDSPIRTVYVNTGWLRSQEHDGDEIFLTISDEDEPAEPAGRIGADEVPPGVAFDTFLSSSIIERAGSRITTARIWRGWASHCGADPDSDRIGGIRKDMVSGRFRAHFSAPRASRGRVDGPVEYFWEGYDIV